MSTVETNLVQPSTGTNLQLGASGDTVDVPSGATLDVTGATVTGLSAGKVLQVVTLQYSTIETLSGGASWNNTGLSLAITPASTSNKVLVLISASIGTTTSEWLMLLETAPLSTKEQQLVLGLPVQQVSSIILTPPAWRQLHYLIHQAQQVRQLIC